MFENHKYIGFINPTSSVIGKWSLFMLQELDLSVDLNAASAAEEEWWRKICKLCLSLSSLC